MNLRSIRSALCLTALFAAMAVVVPGQAPPGSGADRDWPVYRGDPEANQYVPLAQIHAANVHRLVPAWEYHTGDATQRSTMHVNPIVVNGRMYITTPSLKAVALDAATGREIWSFDPSKYNERGAVIRLRNRGVTYWKGQEGERIFHFVKDRMYALDAQTGRLMSTFGKSGYVDLREGLGVDPATVGLEMTSPGAIYRNLLILGSRVNESYDASPGHIRAYDVLTGRLVWVFHTIPQKDQPGHETWKWTDGEMYGGANAWGGITVDEQRGWAFAATGSATDDFYGGFRKGSNLYANSVLALDAATGALKWHYQTVHHDIWDYDNPAAPILVTLTTGTTSKDAVVQLTKMGFTFVLDRETGQPLFPVNEVPVPGSTVPGEEAWPTQPIPVKPAPLVRQSLTETDLTNVSPAAHEHALKEFRKYRSGSDLHAAKHAGHPHATRPPGRKRMARWRLRSILERPLRQCERRADHQSPSARPRCARGWGTDSDRAWPANLRAQLRCVPRSGTARLASADAVARQPEEEPTGARGGHPPGPQQHAGLRLSASAGDDRARRLPRESADAFEGRPGEPAGRSIHDRGLHSFRRSRRRAGNCSAMGHAERDRSDQGRASSGRCRSANTRSSSPRAYATPAP